MLAMSGKPGPFGSNAVVGKTVKPPDGLFALLPLFAPRGPEGRPARREPSPEGLGIDSNMVRAPEARHQPRYPGPANLSAFRSGIAIPRLNSLLPNLKIIVPYGE
jgi:hypothetical protein